VSRVCKEVIFIVILALVAGFINNSISHSRVKWVGNWPSLEDLASDSIWHSDSYDLGDPPLVNLSDAIGLYQNPEVIFVDARFPEEFESGHIEGAINLSIESEDEEFNTHLEQFIALTTKETPVVTYCSGAECESSLYLARYLQLDMEYTNVKIFFGGWRKWADANLPIVGSPE